MSNTSPIVSVTTPTDQLIDLKTGKGLLAFIKWMQQVGALLNKVFSGQGMISPDSVPFPTPTALGGVTSASPVTHQWIDSIDGNGNPHLSQPNYTDLAGNVPSPSQSSRGGVLASVATAKQFVTAIGTTGAPSTAQPSFADLNGEATAVQIPDLSDIDGQITSAQLPAGALNGTVPLAKLTLAGADGSITFVNGQATSAVNPT